MWRCRNTLTILKKRHTAVLIAWSHPGVEKGGLIMIIGDLASSKQTEAISAASVISDVRTLIASHLGVNVSRVTDEAHFIKDLGADWLDRLDLMMAVEEQFGGVEITDADVDRIELVGDLIRHVETWDNERRRRGAALRNLFGPHVARVPAKQQASRDEAALFF